MPNVDPYRRPWPCFLLGHIDGSRSMVVIEPGPVDESANEEFLRAYQMAWFHHQILQGVDTLQDTTAVMKRAVGGWEVYDPNE